MTTDNIFPIEKLRSRLQKFINTIRDSGQIIAFYLFGSYAAGRATPQSDIDLAILFDKSFERERYLPERLRLMGELSIVLETDRVELVVLNEAPPALAYRVFFTCPTDIFRRFGKAYKGGEFWWWIKNSPYCACVN
ncbi:DNA polymerase beta domain protein region [Thermincola potens JR]|uniref:DNA polymerase beta domain protein region n=1 Tax=Thermincola potens (strain JR) TaxID=635013 RepID=D5XBQ5_THEPJ|nr:nucleotidyltransferase domain-containing protein [Thermincola potens]ADG81453.1 DNA polymerase beta domain protein region [Thermincola potens JR]